MQFYMKIEGIDGDVTAKGHEKWIELESVSFGTEKTVRLQTGVEFDRQIGRSYFYEVEIVKKNRCHGKSAFIRTILWRSSF